MLVKRGGQGEQEENEILVNRKDHFVTQSLEHWLLLHSSLDNCSKIQDVVTNTIQDIEQIWI